MLCALCLGMTLIHVCRTRRPQGPTPCYSPILLEAKYCFTATCSVPKLGQALPADLGLTGSTFNLGAAISAFTRDSANEFIVGRQYNELDLDDFGIGLSTASQGAGTFWRTTKHIRWFGPTMRAIPINWAMKVADDDTKAFLRCLNVTNC